MHSKQNYPPPRRKSRSDGSKRLSILCKINLNLLPRDLDLSNRFNVKTEPKDWKANNSTPSSVESSSSRKRKSERDENNLMPSSKRCKQEQSFNIDIIDSKSDNESSRKKVESSTSISSYGNFQSEDSGNWSSISAATNNLMPPPTKMFYSYMEQRRGDEEEEDNESEDISAYMTDAKQLKHEADRETDRERQAMKYLEAVLIFILCGNLQEQRGEKNAAFTMYKETLSLIR
jgi:hypothetical protein